MVFFVQQSPPVVAYEEPIHYFYYDLPMRVLFFLSFSFCLRLCLLLLTCFLSSVKSRRNIKITTTMNQLLFHRFKPGRCALISFFPTRTTDDQTFVFSKNKSARQTIFYVLSNVGITCMTRLSKLDYFSL